MFFNAQKAIILQTTLEELGHPQPPTPINIDNYTAARMLNKFLKQRKSKEMTVIFFWIRDRVLQGHFIILWAPGTENKGDFNTKHQPASHDMKERYNFLQPSADANTCALGIIPQFLRGCANLATYIIHKLR